MQVFFKNFVLAPEKIPAQQPKVCPLAQLFADTVNRIVYKTEVNSMFTVSQPHEFLLACENFHYL